ncbi:MAG: TonB-dependent receptor [Cytophagaceae bacterium]|jgi:iron complex outermembrane receptor protein|nr:TonB-dependent receptor [Cytophagaceae bacterium]
MFTPLLIICQSLFFTFSGTVKDAQTKEVLPTAYVRLETVASVMTANDGGFSFSKVPSGTYSIQVRFAGYDVWEDSIFLTKNIDSFSIELTPSVLNERVIVEGIRSVDNFPVTTVELNKQQLQEKYYGYDVPYVINNTPAVNAYSDNGTGIGYSYFRLRGIDQTRINLTVNGIPINDPENQGFFFNNFADLTSSAQQIQIQRGVGTSTNGTAAFGGSINILTNDLKPSPHAAIHLGYGSFQTSRITAEAGTGILPNKTAFYGRISSIQTDGYRQQSASAVRSWFFSGASYGKKSILKFNAWGGFSTNELSYVGVSKATLDTARRNNPLTPAETDYFNQTFFQLQYSKSFNSSWKLSASAYHVMGTGWFDVRFNDWPYALMNMPDVNGNTTANFIARYWLKQRFTGAFATLHHKYSKGDTYIGVHANAFASDHYMTVPWASTYPSTLEPNHEAYFNTGYKNEASIFFKHQHVFNSKWTAFIDAQLRSASFRYKGEDKPIYRDTFDVEKMNWLFFNPKAGIAYQLSKGLKWYATIGKTSREPARIDYLTDDRANFDVKQSDVKPERVVNIETGMKIKTGSWIGQVNLYAMEFKNEIVLTGQLNAFGLPLRSNAAGSFRRGIEVDLNYTINKNWSVYNATSLSYNRLKEFNQKYVVNDENGNYLRDTSVLYTNVQPVFTPSFIFNQGIRYSIPSILQVDVIGKYMSSSFLDNSNVEAVLLPSFGFVDARVTLFLNRWIKQGQYTLSLQCNNVTNQLYSHSGSVSVYGYVLTQSGNSITNSTSPSFFPAATRNFMLTFSAKF